MIKQVNQMSQMLYQLPGEQGHVVYDGKTHAPFGILGEFHDGRQQGL